MNQEAVTQIRQALVRVMQRYREQPEVRKALWEVFAEVALLHRVANVRTIQETADTVPSMSAAVRL
jgi:hypothetical protein